MRRRWKTVALVMAVAVVALSVVAVAYGATRSQAPKGANRPGACAALMSNPKALRAMQDLRVEHRKDMQAWYDRYGADPSNSEAQAALQQLRDEHRSDMQGLLKRFGIKAGALGTGRGMMGGGCGGGCGGAGYGSGASQGTGYGMMGGTSY